MIRAITVASAFAVALAIQAPAGAALTYEGFNYTPVGANALNSKNGGTGFAGAWGTQNADLVSGSFSYTDGNGNQLVTSGNRAFMDSTSTAGTSPPEPAGVSIAPIRTITTITGAPTTLYLSFLAQQTAGTDRDISVSLFAAGNGTFGTAERLTVGHGNGFTTWGAYALAVGTNGAHSTSPANQVGFLVARVDLNANGVNERIRLYVNPTLGVEPGVADVDFDTFNIIDTIPEITRIRMRAGGSNATQTASQVEADELRLDLTYAGVTPMVPEPASALLGLIGVGFVASRRRR